MQKVHLKNNLWFPKISFRKSFLCIIYWCGNIVYVCSCLLNSCGERHKNTSFSWIFYILFQGAGHNDVELYNQYLERLRHFVSQELTNWHSATAATSSASKPVKSSSTSEETTTTTGKGNNSSTKKDNNTAKETTTGSQEVVEIDAESAINKNTTNNMNKKSTTKTTNNANNVKTTSNSSLSISNQDATNTNNLNFPANTNSNSKQTAEIVNKQLTNGKAPSEKFL